MPAFKLRLEDTYWRQGFFNVTVDLERFFARDNGSIDIYLGASSDAIRGRIDRNANRNGTPRIHGNKPLREFFQTNFKVRDLALVEIVSPEAIRITRP